MKHKNILESILHKSKTQLEGASRPLQKSMSFIVGPKGYQPRKGNFQNLLVLVMLGLSSNTVQLFTSNAS